MQSVAASIEHRRLRLIFTRYAMQAESITRLHGDFALGRRSTALSCPPDAAATIDAGQLRFSDKSLQFRRRTEFTGRDEGGQNIAYVMRLRFPRCDCNPLTGFAFAFSFTSSEVNPRNRAYLWRVANESRF